MFAQRQAETWLLQLNVARSEIEEGNRFHHQPPLPLRPPVQNYHLPAWQTVGEEYQQRSD